ncbi:hypothetical protein [Methanobacterium formicicum]|uniref:SIR2-like domain-containing protein n=1 Tax=Methanobacterium formicicum TaxID=2162 RepID=A0A843AUY6_METFO|nr:hypothetical protein [Methanobacterium formicicum]MBF4474545.1 hypothetical protein [Methanobacterium formicicum]
MKLNGCEDIDFLEKLLYKFLIIFTHMIETPTTLILGAGASKPYGYPLGNDLKDKIIHSLNAMVENESGWVDELDINPFLVTEFTQKLKGSKRPSIDSFLKKQKLEFKDIGKLAIADIISKCEKPEINDPRRLKSDITLDENDDWYTNLVEILYECDEVEQVSENINIISYNYDRSLEYFLLQPLKDTFKELKNVKQAAEIIKEIPIIHMYGRLDPLPWEEPSDETQNRDYGEKCTSDDILRISQSIILMYEAEKKGYIDRANEVVNKSKRVYFLGLDLYRNRKNIELLDLSLLQTKRVLVTAYELGGGKIKNVTNFFEKVQRPKIMKTIVANSKSLQAIEDHMPF